MPFKWWNSAGQHFLKVNSKDVLSIISFIIPSNQPGAHFVDIYIELVAQKKKKKSYDEILETSSEAEKMHVLPAV